MWAFFVVLVGLFFLCVCVSVCFLSSILLIYLSIYVFIFVVRCVAPVHRITAANPLLLLRNPPLMSFSIF